MLRGIIQAIPVSVLGFADITDVLQEININGLPNSCFMLRITNSTDKDLVISFDGIHENDLLLSRTTSTLLGQTNAGPTNYVANWQKGLIIWVAGEAGNLPTSGDIVLSGYYQPVQEN